MGTKLGKSAREKQAPWLFSWDAAFKTHDFKVFWPRSLWLVAKANRYNASVCLVKVPFLRTKQMILWSQLIIRIARGGAYQERKARRGWTVTQTLVELLLFPLRGEKLNIPGQEAWNMYEDKMKLGICAKMSKVAEKGKAKTLDSPLQVINNNNAVSDGIRFSIPVSAGPKLKSVTAFRFC